MPLALTETARQEGRILQEEVPGRYVVSRTLFRRGLQSLQHLYFNQLDDFFKFLDREEPGQPAFDPADLSLVYLYALPTSPETRIYTLHYSDVADELKRYQGNQLLNQRALYFLPGVYTWQM